MEIKVKINDMLVCTNCDCLNQFRIVDKVLYPFCPECDSATSLVKIGTWEEMNGVQFDW